MAPPRVAAICGVYRPHSHADVGIGKLIHGETLTRPRGHHLSTQPWLTPPRSLACCAGHPTDEGLLAPRVQVVSLYMDQVADGDIGAATAAAHGIPVGLSSFSF